MQRKYSIHIGQRKGAPQLADNVQLNFRCYVSEPSIWVAEGLTKEKGLTFLDNNEQSLNSDIFRNQAYFNPAEETSQTETEAIRSFIYSALYEHYRFEKVDIDVSVAAI